MKDYGTISDQIITMLEQAGFTLDEMQSLVLTLNDKLDLIEKEAARSETD